MHVRICVYVCVCVCIYINNVSQGHGLCALQEKLLQCCSCSSSFLLARRLGQAIEEETTGWRSKDGISVSVRHGILI